MAMRPKRARMFRNSAQAGAGGRYQLILAHVILRVEQILSVFARPLLIGVLFIGLAWLGLFNVLYPWAHLVALFLFVVLFFDSLGRAHSLWKPISNSAPKRRVEEASGLSHRPLDVVDDRPATLGDDQWALWQVHTSNALKSLEQLRFPIWKLDMKRLDPYGFRFGALALLIIGLITGWGALGGRILTSLNPALGNWHMSVPALDAWITPPEYTHLSPIMIVTPAGARHDTDVVDVPEGSVLSAHLAEKEGTAPTLIVNDENQDFKADSSKDYEALATIKSGDRISIRRGWQTLGSWHIRVMPDQAPKVAFSDQPTVTERKTLRIPFEATDDYGVTTVKLRVTPRETLAGVSSDPIDVPLATAEAKDVKRAAFEDLTAHPWAGLPVTLQLVVADAAGHEGVSEVQNFTLPERIFLNPIARTLVEERKKLLESPLDDTVRNEAANIMAGVAHQPDSYHSDPVILMALRAGAVRLVLDHSQDATLSVDDILWEAALHIEDGNTGSSEAALRQAQNDLADALDSHASEADIQKIIDRLHQALGQYLSELSSRMAQQPGPTEDLGQLMGQQNNMLSPDDLERMLDQMRNLSASGSRDAARNELAHLQQLLENLRTQPTQLTDEQRAALQKLKDMRALVHDQQKLIDKTFQTSTPDMSSLNKGLAAEQKGLLNRLQSMMPQGKDQSAAGDKDNQGASLNHSADAMERAGSELQSGANHMAVAHQNEALKALQQAEEQMQDELRQGLFMMPQPGQGMAGRDPFGRDYGGLFHDDGSVKVPDQMQVRHVREILDELQRRAGDMNRPKGERDYIDRLLQNF